MSTPDFNEGSSPVLAANVEMRVYPGDEEPLLLARTPTEISLGIIRFPKGYISSPFTSLIMKDEAIVAYFPENTEIHNMLKPVRIAFNQQPLPYDQAGKYVGYLLNLWNPSIWKDLEIIEHDTSAAVYEPQFKKGKETVSLRKEEENNLQLARIQKAGIVIPLNEVVDLYVRSAT